MVWIGGHCSHNLFNSNFTHTVVCGAPLFPPNSTNTTVSGTTVGAMATFQYEEGLIPSGPTTSICTDTETGGQWLPNPADTQCTISRSIPQQVEIYS